MYGETKHQLRISAHYNQLLDYEYQRLKITKKKLVNEILFEFQKQVHINGDYNEYICFINSLYMRHMMDKYKHIPNISQSITVVLNDDIFDKIHTIVQYFPFKSTKVLELACHYYFYILPDDCKEHNNNLHKKGMISNGR